MLRPAQALNAFPKNEMRRFLKNLTLFLALQLIIWAGIVAVYVRCRPIGQHYLAASIDKQALLRGQPAPRVVFVGGSNLAFGLNSTAIANQSSLKPVNMGLHVELGLDFMLKEAKRGLHTGDVVVISPEYELFGDGYAGGGEILYTALEQHPGNIQYFSWRNAIKVTDQGFLLASQILDYDYRCLAGQKSDYDPNDPDNVYKRSAFNQYGDVVAHYGMARKEFPIPELDPKVTSLTIRRTINELSDFQHWAARNGVVVVFSFPVVPQVYIDKNRLAIEKIKNAVAELTLPILDSPEEMTLPPEDFFDTPYHLTEAGTTKRAAHLLTKLRERGTVE